MRACLLPLLGLLASCGAIAPGTLTPEDFISTEALPQGPAPGPAPVPRVAPEEARQGVLTVRASPGGPELDPGLPVQGTVGAVYDAKIGEISGRPIFVNAFLEPLEAQLEQEGRTLPRDQWMQRATRAISDRLNGIVVDQLLSDEGLSLLTPEQRMRLSTLTETWRAKLLSQNYGSEQLAAERLLAEREMTIDDYLREQRRALLIQYVIENEVRSKIKVTLDDVRRAYQANYQRFNPPGVVVMREITVPASDDAAVARVRDALASGVRFDEVARTMDNVHNRAEGGRFDVALSGPFEDEPVHANEELDRLVHTLSPGTWAGPVAVGGTLSWIYLEEVRHDTVTLDEAQLLLTQEIIRTRTQQEQQRFLVRLMERAGFTEQDLERMGQELLQVAVQRYAPR